ncbi:hypothetical protein Emtol_0176 (plasmid) [Emticicia oligotrophica DSM 17448]|uniref:Uncharacterized protein n=1 Tax=Emticicia oligotrophica (strain DSM 17448 / CIP 109782 / MTCC 6937 / GPTSA100-15) TaxID=929562 RepID=A0ABN4AU58_EMTOG|nr:hypothetical protein [Emticicia oligotrophica]AFK05448.1 hypothetical protein Emtol_0176 [Emticicia oligotrophica DSM 17448]
MQLFKNQLPPPFDYISFIQVIQSLGFFIEQEAEGHLIILNSPLDEDVSLQLITNFQKSDKQMDANFRHLKLYQYSKKLDAYIGESHFIKVDEQAITTIKIIIEKMTNRFVRGVYRCACGEKYLRSIRTKDGNIFSCLGNDCEGVTLTQQEILTM